MEMPVGLRGLNSGTGSAMKRRPADNSGNGVVTLIDGLLARALDAEASDIHFEPMDQAIQVRLRIDGVLQEFETIPLSLHPNIVTRLKVMAGLLSYRVDIPQEGGLTLKNARGVDARVSTFPTVRGERVVVRLLPTGSGVRDLQDLGLSDSLVENLLLACSAWQGLILVTGPAGSGKTTTLYALLRHLQATHKGVSLMTVEDPVELRLDGVAQTQVTPRGEMTYARALRSLLRQDPQVVLIGEVRDSETAKIATEAALTGHLILSTMHSGFATDAVVRLLEMGIAPYELTSTLKLVVCQRLLRTTCVDCGRTGTVGCGGAGTADERNNDGSCCSTCLGSGYKGRTACAEFALMSPELRAAMLSKADSEQLRKAIGSQPTHVELAVDAERHRAAHRTTEDEIRRQTLRRGTGS